MRVYSNLQHLYLIPCVLESNNKSIKDLRVIKEIRFNYLAPFLVFNEVTLKMHWNNL